MVSRFFILTLGLAAAIGGCQLVAGSDKFAFGSGASSAEGGQGGAADGGGGSGAGEAGGGTGGEAPMCAVAEDCPGVQTTCQKRTCTDGICGQENEFANHACSEDGGQVCNGDGLCVRCINAVQHCAPTEACVEQICVPASCANTMRDNDETGLDCGGADCAPCAEGLGCDVATDCLTRFCDTSGGGGGAGGTDAAGVCAMCGVHSDCEATEWCDGGTCTAKKTQGALCGDEVECENNTCVEGVCCDDGCDGACQSCLAFYNGNENGVCGFIGSGQDPYNECLLGLACNGDGGCL